eukprot:2552812-Pleurochrysis_carterae.AAC.1
MTAGAFLFSLASVEAAGSNLSPTIPSPCSSDISTCTSSPSPDLRDDPLPRLEGDLNRSRSALAETMAACSCFSLW